MLPSLIRTARHTSSKDLSTGGTMAIKLTVTTRNRSAMASPAFQMTWMQPWYGVEMAKYISSKVANSGVTIQ